VLAEQFNPHTGEPISVSPLTWSHAVVMTTVMQYLLKHAQITGARSGVLAEMVQLRNAAAPVRKNLAA
jgi:hypothetical protein